MRLVAISVLSPVIAALFVWAGYYVFADEHLMPVIVAIVLTVGMPIAIVLALITSIYLRKRLLTESWTSFVLCSLWGGFLAVMVTLIYAGPNPLLIPFVTWGAVAGLLYRILLGRENVILTDR